MRDEDVHRFRIGMLARHPTLDLAPLLAPLGITPVHCRVAGEPRVGAAGQTLPGTAGFSFWSWSRQIEGDRDFAAAVASLADELAPHRDLFESLRSTGGRIAISVALTGSNNIGATFSVLDMTKLAGSGLDLDIEVFPHLKDQP